MNVYKKLNISRNEFHQTELKKTGHNKFANYYYFELGDFIIPALKIFNENGLTSVISFGKEEAKMTIINNDKPDEQIIITSPMSTAALKGCHEVQNLGAVQTYLRRYLWVAALEIVEHDALDSSPGKSTSIDAGVLADCLAAIDASSSLPELQKSFTEAIKASKDDQAAQAKIIAAKDAKKASLK
jgi:hypothetical protein